MNSDKVSLKGSYLPAIGGVSVHISRLAELLSNDGILACVYSSSICKGFTESRFIVKDVHYPKLRYSTLQSLLWLLRYGIKDCSKIMHIHGHPVWDSPTLFLLLLILRKRVVFTIHDQMILSNLGGYPKILLYLLERVMNNRNIRWIVVNPTIKDQIERIRSNCINVSVIPAYLPLLADDTPLNYELESFIKTKSRIMSIYAHSTRKYKGKDLYGIDQAIRATAFVKKSIHDIGLIICIPGEVIKEQLMDYQQIIDESRILDNVLLFLKPVNNPVNLWRRSDIVLRPTLTDGDSLVIREAMSQGTSVIASDVVQRHEDVVLFKSEDVRDLSSKILHTLDMNNKRSKPSATGESNYELIKTIYASFNE
jgi:glycosyltransferase involved in cell wall biosynthesis